MRDIAAPRARAAAATGVSFRVAPGEIDKNVRLDGAGGAPKVLVTGPGGQSLTLSADGMTRAGALVGLRADEFGATFIGLDHARQGTYTITPLPGSVALRTISTTKPGYDTNFTGRLTAAGSHRTLHYDARKPGGGQRVTFYEEGAGVMHRLGASTGGQGAIRFTPAPGPGGERTIVAGATVDGSPIQNQTIARFHFAGTGRAGRPRRVTVRRVGRTVSVRWSAVAGTVRYGVVVDRSDGSQQRLVLSARRRSLRITRYPLTEGGRISVSAQGALGDWGNARRSATFKAVRKPTSVFLSPRKTRR